MPFDFFKALASFLRIHQQNLNWETGYFYHCLLKKHPSLDQKPWSAIYKYSSECYKEVTKA